MSKLDKKYFGASALVDNWKKQGDNNPVIKVEYDEDNSIKLPQYDEELDDTGNVVSVNKTSDEVVSTSFKLDVLPGVKENVAEKLAAKVMLEDLLEALGLDSSHGIRAEEKGEGEDTEVVLTIASK